MASTFYIMDVDLKDELGRMAAAHKRKGTNKPLFNVAASIPFQPSCTVETKYYKKIESDKLLRRLVDKKSKPIYDKMLVDAENLIKACGEGDGPATKEELDDLASAVLDVLDTACEKIVTDSLPEMDAYTKDRMLGKLAKQKYDLRKFKGILKVTAGVASTGLAIASAIASLGVTTPAIAAAVYASYKGVKETADAFKKAGRSYEEHGTSIENTIQLLKDKYAGMTEEEIKSAMGHAEARGKALKELTGFTGQTIKKLEDSIKHFDKSIKVGLYVQSRQGKEVGKLEKALNKLEKHLEELEDELKKSSGKDADKLVTKIDLLEEKAKTIKKQMEEVLDTAEADREKLLQAQTLSADWKLIATDYKAKRPDWVRHVSKPLKFTNLILAGAAMDYNKIAEDTVNVLVEGASSVAGELSQLGDENKKYAGKKK
jgi:hypothetical protein